MAGQDAAALTGQSVRVFLHRAGVFTQQDGVDSWSPGDRSQVFLCQSQPWRSAGRLVVLTDISEQTRASAGLRLADEISANTAEGILIADAQGRITAVNPAFSRITGYGAVEVVGKVARILGARAETDPVLREVRGRLECDGRWQGELPDRRKNGEFYPAWLSVSAVRDSQGLLTHYVSVFSDFTVHKEAESRLQYLAERDTLTQLLNRTAVHKRLEVAVGQACVDKRNLVLLFIDLDRFKHINDTLGHAVGDELLQVVALRLRHCLKPADVIGRLGGDEFTVLIESQLPQRTVLAIVERIAGELSRPCLVQGHELAITCSIGVSRYPQDADGATELMRTADMAMYRAKEIGKNTYQFYADELDQRNSETTRLETSLRAAITRQEFVLHFQPQYALQGEALVGLEALVRWQHPELGMVPPGSFIPLAEASGLIVPIGEWVLRESCRQLAKWRASGFDVPRVAVNLAATQITRGELVALIRDILAQTGVEPFRLELEITESMLMENQKEAVATLTALRELGIRIAVDDFGTGYSSLANLKDYPVDCLKIDRHFVEHVPDDEDSDAIIEAIVALARRMHLQIVAEGIENEKQASFLRHAGCEIGQGYFYGRPQDAAYFANVWKSGTSFEV